MKRKRGECGKTIHRDSRLPRGFDIYIDQDGKVTSTEGSLDALEILDNLKKSKRIYERFSQSRHQDYCNSGKK